MWKDAFEFIYPSHPPVPLRLVPVASWATERRNSGIGTLLSGYFGPMLWGLKLRAFEDLVFAIEECAFSDSLTLFL